MQLCTQMNCLTSARGLSPGGYELLVNPELFIRKQAKGASPLRSTVLAARALHLPGEANPGDGNRGAGLARRWLAGCCARGVGSSLEDRNIPYRGLFCNGCQSYPGVGVGGDTLLAGKSSARDDLLPAPSPEVAHMLSASPAFWKMEQFQPVTRM